MTAAQTQDLDNQERPDAAAQTPLRPGRPTTARSEAINPAIVTAAREHFLALGFDATPMESVAAAAGISKGTLYARYPTKELLLQAVVADRVEAWQAAADARNGPMPADLKQRLTYISRSIVESLASEEIHAFQRVLTSTSDAGGELARALHEAGHRNAIALLTQTLVEGTAHFPAPPRNPSRVAEMLMAMLTGWYEAHRRVRAIGSEEAMAYAEHAVDVMFHGRMAW
jgi:TetR/AcrR family transcriptional repressor of mexJK operon